MIFKKQKFLGMVQCWIYYQKNSFISVKLCGLKLHKNEEEINLYF